MTWVGEGGYMAHSLKLIMKQKNKMPLTSSESSCLPKGKPSSSGSWMIPNRARAGAFPGHHHLMRSDECRWGLQSLSASCWPVVGRRLSTSTGLPWWMSHCCCADAQQRVELLSGQPAPLSGLCSREPSQESVAVLSSSRGQHFVLSLSCPIWHL